MDQHGFVWRPMGVSIDDGTKRLGMVCCTAVPTIQGSGHGCLAVVPASRFVANVTLTGLSLPPSSVRNVFFYSTEGDAASHAGVDGTVSCAKPSSLLE